MRNDSATLRAIDTNAGRALPPAYSRPAAYRRWRHIPILFVLLVFVGALGTPVATGPVAIKVDIGTLGGTTTNPAAMNASGQIGGWSTTRDGAPHAFSWTPLR